MEPGQRVVVPWDFFHFRRAREKRALSLQSATSHSPIATCVNFIYGVSFISCPLYISLSENAGKLGKLRARSFTRATWLATLKREVTGKLQGSCRDVGKVSKEGRKEELFLCIQRERESREASFFPLAKQPPLPPEEWSARPWGKRGALLDKNLEVRVA
jgi:hypothetical protein